MRYTFDDIHGADSDKSCPRFDIDEETYKKVNRLLTPYVFYKKYGKGNARQCYCTRCEQDYIVDDAVRTVSNNDFEMLIANHNQNVVCPKCGTHAQLKNIGKAKGCQNLYETTAVAIVIKKSKNNVVVATYDVVKKYNGGYYKACISFYPQMIYQITPQGARCWQRNYYSRTMLKVSKCYKSQVYHIINAELLEGTFLKYCGYQYYLSRPDRFANFLCNVPTHPTYEMMLKLGFKEFVDESVEGRDNTRIINWQGKKPTEAFKKFDKKQFNEFRENGGTVQLYKNWLFMQKYGQHSFSEIAKITDSYRWREIIEKAETLGVKTSEFIKYCDKQAVKRGAEYYYVRTIDWWYDYIKDAEFLKYDLTDRVVLLPKNIIKAHETSIELVRAIREEERKRQEAERAKKEKQELAAAIKTEKKLHKKRAKQYEYQSGDFLIKMPDDLRAIVDEGQSLHHCVGGYAQRHAEGQTTILFMRSALEPDISLYTIEMHGKELRQVHGLRNRAIEEENAKVFFDEWLAWVKAGSLKKEESRNTEENITIIIPIKNNKLERVTA